MYVWDKDSHRYRYGRRDPSRAFRILIPTKAQLEPTIDGKRRKNTAEKFLAASELLEMAKHSKELRDDLLHDFYAKLEQQRAEQQVLRSEFKALKINLPDTNRGYMYGDPEVLERMISYNRHMGVYAKREREERRNRGEPEPTVYQTICAKMSVKLPKITLKNLFSLPKTFSNKIGEVPSSEKDTQSSENASESSEKVLEGSENVHGSHEVSDIPESSTAETQEDIHNSVFRYFASIK